MLPALDYSNPKPINEQISDWMRVNIIAGLWPNNYQLQAESNLAAALKVSRGTIRKAIENLISEQLLTRVHGKGTFVQQPLVLEQKPQGRIAGFSRDLTSKGIPFETIVHLQEVVNPRPSIAHILAISAENRILHMERSRIVRGKPVVFVENHLVYSFCPGIEEDNFVNNPLYTTLEGKYKLELDWARRTYRAVTADSKISKYLEINIGAPVMYLEELYHLAGNRPVEFTRAWINAEIFHITTKIKRSDEIKDPNSLYK